MASTIKEFVHLQIPLDDVLKATNNFADENIIGKGGFGNVYKGKLMRSGGELIDISARRLDRKHGQGEVEFWTEISVVSGLDRYHADYMIGFCDEKGEKIIINRHQANGSLSMHVSNPAFTWSQRLSVSSDIVEALKYIHFDVDYRYYIIHRNINSFTILLNDKWMAKLSGFEFSIKHAEHRMNQVFLCEPIGTRGYMDPAILKSGGVTHKSDIYSFGVVLFELLCGRKAVEDNKLLAPLAKHHYENGTLQDIIHPDLWNQMKPESFKYFSDAAYSCLEEKLAHRPDAQGILQNIGKACLIQRKDEKEDQDHSPLDSEKDGLQVTEKGKLIDFKSVPSNPWKVKKLDHLRIGLRDIQLAINDFSETFKIVSGHIYDGYKTKLECVDREYLSSMEAKNIGELPKRLYTVKIMCAEYSEYLLREIEIISSCKHRNIESLLGFCDEGPEMILVYEFISATHLKSNLDNHDLTWGKRVKLCLDIAHGLNYLHHEMENQKTVIHGNISCWTIELDDNLEGKIGGFNYAVFLTPCQDDDTLIGLNQIASTSLFVDPEYIKSDVYSFGSLMIEILCGKFISHITSSESFSDNERGHMVRQWVDKGSTMRKVAPIIMEENAENRSFLNKGPNEYSLDTFINIACKCLKEKQDERPTMRVIIQELEKALSFHEDNEDPYRLSFEDIRLATQNFSHGNYVGGGGFGRVYKGELTHVHGDGHIVAKQLDTSHGQGETQFYNELQILYEYKHENVIGLVGYSNETDEKIIVYEHASKGSLDRYLNHATLRWRNRLKICIDFATGLDFLHCGVDGQEVVIHRDIKTANILLFDDWTAKIGDFGLSIISTVNYEADYVIDHACGTEGYLDPLYLKSGFLTIESDIYSFGVVLFEILCGRSTYAIRNQKGQYLPSFIKHMFAEGKQDEVVFEAIKGEIVPQSLTTFQNIAYQCIDDDREKRPKAKEVLSQLKKALEFQDNEDPYRLSFEDIRLATQNFSHGNCVGGGGFGRLYKGELAHVHGDGHIVAKQLDTSHGQGETQFYNELQILYEYKHENVIGLVGYSNETDEKIIVYEHASMGSLDRYLNHATLRWRNRLKICIDFATGLDFLHCGVDGQEMVIHRDIKTANILLFDDWTAKIGDFGLSIISTVNKEADYVIDHVCGTEGYLDPLYLKSGFLTIESDIYSFGVVLFEILCGRSTYAIHNQKGQYLPSFIKHMFAEGKQDEVVFEAIKEEIVPQSLTTFQNIAYQCIDDDREKRPTAKEVLSQLKKAFEFQEEGLNF